MKERGDSFAEVESYILPSLIWFPVGADATFQRKVAHLMIVEGILPIILLFRWKTPNPIESEIFNMEGREKNCLF
jgi:hypothetical protein